MSFDDFADWLVVFEPVCHEEKFVLYLCNTYICVTSFNIKNFLGIQYMAVVKIGVAGPVGSGKTALLERLTRHLFDFMI